MNLSIWIRTHSQRLYLAEHLETMCNAAFGIIPTLLHTGEASPHYSYKFAISLMNQMVSCSCEHILLLEDDILLTDTSVEAVRRALVRGDTHNWYTADTTTDVLKNAVYIPEFGYVLTNASHITYSGAVLVSRDILSEYLESYMLEVTEMIYPNFDVNLSAHILDVQGHIHLRPGHFLHNTQAESSVDPEGVGRVNHARGECFTYDGPLT